VSQCGVGRSGLVGVIARSMLGRTGRDRNAVGGLTRSMQCEGKAGPFVRSDNSQSQGNAARGLGVSLLAARFAAGDDRVGPGRALRLGVAVAGLTQELSPSCR